MHQFTIAVRGSFCVCVLVLPYLTYPFVHRGSEQCDVDSVVAEPNQSNVERHVVWKRAMV